MPSIEALEISKKIRGEEEEDIPDMGEYEEADNLIETDPVRSCLCCVCILVLRSV